MDLLLVAADHVLVVVVDVLRSRAGTPASREDVPAELGGGSEARDQFWLTWRALFQFPTAPKPPHENIFI